jgi:hypothetical protein
LALADTEIKTQRAMALMRGDFTGRSNSSVEASARTG